MQSVTIQLKFEKKIKIKSPEMNRFDDFKPIKLHFRPAIRTGIGEKTTLSLSKFFFFLITSAKTM